MGAGGAVMKRVKTGILAERFMCTAGLRLRGPFGTTPADVSHLSLPACYPCHQLLSNRSQRSKFHRAYTQPNLASFVLTGMTFNPDIHMQNEVGAAHRCRACLRIAIETGASAIDVRDVAGR